MKSLYDLPLERVYLATLLCGVWESHLASTDWLNPVDCATPDHQKVLECIYELASRGDEVSTLSVLMALERGHDTAPALRSLEAITQAPLTGESPALIAERLSSYAAARRTREHLVLGVAAAERLHLEAAQEHARDATAEGIGSRITTISAHGVVSLALHAMRANAGKTAVLMRSGYGLVDGAVRGLPPRSLMIIGGRTSAGKSTIALGISIYAAQQGVRTGIVSCEDPETLWGGRVLSHVCDLNAERLLDPQMSFTDQAEADRGLEVAREIGVEFVFALNRPLEDVLAAMRALVAGGCKALVVDYLQAIRLGVAKGRATRAELVSDAAQQLKAQAQALGVPLILCSQLRRADSAKPFAEPHAGDLKESGDLENMAEVIMLLWKSSDAEDARLLGKIAKVKWSKRRPRFELQLDERTGALRSLSLPREDEDEQRERKRFQS